MSEDANDRGPFRIQVVAELTGVPEPTLRAWERRYGIPRPERTASGYRLYGREDVEQVRSMRKLCDGGMAAAEAAQRVKASSGRDAAAAAAALPRDFDPYEAALEAILDAVERFDEEALSAELRRLLFLGSATALLDRVIAPALVRIGDLWHAGELTVAEEHFASQHLTTLLRDLLRLVLGAEGTERLILASFADDQHELGLLGAALRFASWGYRPVFLGARTPPGALRGAIDASDARLVGLSLSISLDRGRARELVDAYAVACGQVPWIVGGAGVREIADLVTERGGHVSPSDPNELRALAHQLIATPGRRPDGAGGRRATSAARSAQKKRKQ